MTEPVRMVAIEDDDWDPFEPEYLQQAGRAGREAAEIVIAKIHAAAARQDKRLKVKRRARAEVEDAGR